MTRHNTTPTNLTDDHPPRARGAAMSTERVDTEAIADKWLQECGPCDVGAPMGCTHPDEDPRPVIAALVDDLERTRRGARTLGETIESQCRMILDITGRHDWIDEDGDGDWGAVWENAYALLPRIKELEAQAAGAQS